MSESSGWSPTDYIKESIKQGVSRFTWKHPDHYTRVQFNTIRILKNEGRINTVHLTNADRVMGIHHNLFKFLGLYFIREAVINKKVEYLLADMNGFNLRLNDDLFAVAFEKLMFDLTDSSTKTQLFMIKRVVESIQHVAKTYAWVFLALAKKDGMVEELDEELYLLREIEIFR